MEAGSFRFIGKDLLSLVRMGAYRIIPLFVLGIVIWRGWSERVFVVPRWVILPAVVGVVALCQYPIACVPVFALIILAGAEQDIDGKTGVLGQSRLVFLGEASYSLYLTHGIVQTVFFNGLRKLHLPVGNLAFAGVAFMAGVLIAVMVSILTYRWIEAPCRNAITNWYGTRSRATETTVVI